MSPRRREWTRVQNIGSAFFTEAPDLSASLANDALMATKKPAGDDFDYRAKPREAAIAAM